MKLIPRLKPYFDHKEVIAALTPTSGIMERFEQSFAQKFECSYGVMFPYGRSGLYSLLKIWDLKDAEVIIPAYTCVVVPHAVALSGNIPVFVDCAEGSFNMDIEGMRHALTRKTRVVIPTHLFGYPMDVNAVDAIVRDAEKTYGHKIYVVQDCAHSFGSKWDGELVTKYGDAALFGLNISKTISSIFGGMVITNNNQIAEGLRSFREKNFRRRGFVKTVKRFLYLLSVYFAFNSYIYYWVNKLERYGLIDRFVKYYDETEIEFPSDWDEMPMEIEARVGLANLEKYDEIVKRRIENAQKYFEYFKNNSQIRLPPNNQGVTFSHFVALVNNRDKWLNEFLERGIQLGKLIEYSIPDMESYRKYRDKEFPNSYRYSQTTINLPNYAALMEKDIVKITKKIKDVLVRYRQSEYKPE